MLKHIKITNLLSFGDPGLDLELGPLNVLIGPNGSGKSNLLLALQLLRALPGDVREAMRQQGGVLEDWVWRGANHQRFQLITTLLTNSVELVHSVSVGIVETVLWFDSEQISLKGAGGDEKLLIWDEEGLKFSNAVFSPGRAAARVREISGVSEDAKPIAVNRKESVLVRHANAGTLIGDVASEYEGSAIYRSWVFGRNTECRKPQPADRRSDRFDEDFGNLAMILSRLRQSVSTKKRLLESLRLVYDGIEDIGIHIDGGYARVVLQESGFDTHIPATRLSDGTLRYICLLAILLDPDPPPLTCIEEPELGLHPDILPEIAKLMIDASTRTQLIVTTHSEIIIDALSETPESVIVTEKHDGATTMKRLDKEALSEWLKDYRLGQLWSRGAIGGNRW